MNKTLAKRQIKKELETLNEMILKMGNFVGKTIHECLEALARQDISLAKSIIASDREIDLMELKVNETCLKLLALYQPVASDLRFITTAMLIATDMERIGDLAVEIASAVVEMGSEPLIKPLVDLPKMEKIAKMMVDKGLKAFVTRDTWEAKSIKEMEDEAVRLRKLIYDEVEGVIVNNPQLISRGLPLILIAYYLERIVGHAANIAEDVVYMVDAEVIKHKKA